MSKFKLLVLLLVVFGGGVAAGQHGTFEKIADRYENSTLANDTDSVATPYQSEKSTTTPEFNDAQSRIDQGLVESYFLSYLNKYRATHDRRPLYQWKPLTEMGNAQAKDMAVNDSYSHVNSQGESIEERYRERGLLPECRLPLSGSDQYYEGAENIAQSYVFTEYKTNWGGGTRVNSGEQELAYDLFKQWMASPPHKRVMMIKSAEKAGLGIYVTESGRVYASLEFC